MNASELKEKLGPMVKNYPRPQAALVPLLHALIDNGVTVSDDLKQPLAEICDVSVGSINSLIDYYPILQGKKPSCPSVCLGLICYLHGAKQIYDQLKSDPTLICSNEAEIKATECMGYCNSAPVIKLDDQIYKMTVNEHTMMSASF